MEEKTYVAEFHVDSKVKQMEYSQLGKTDMRLSKISLGGGPLGGHYGAVKEEDAIAIVHEALKSGVNYIDTAPFYGGGRSEEVIGKALRTVPRSSFYIATKVGRYSGSVEEMFDFSASRVLQGFSRSLELLGLDYVDVIQIHDLEFAEDINQVIMETLPTLSKIKTQGKARYIGITGYPLELLKKVCELSEVKIDVVLTYARNTLINDDLIKYLPFFEEKGIGVLNAALVCMGLLADSQLPIWHPATTEIREASNSALNYCNAFGIELPDIAIKYSLQTAGITSHLMGAASMDILKKNLKATLEAPSEEELKFAKTIKEKFFSSLSKTHWEGKDPERYFNALHLSRAGKPA